MRSAGGAGGRTCSAGWTRISARSAAPSFSTLALSTSAAARSFSTNRQCAAPRDRASRPSAPEPAKRSATRRPSKRAQAAGEHREQPLAGAVAGRAGGEAGRGEERTAAPLAGDDPHYLDPPRDGEGDRARSGVVEGASSRAPCAGAPPPRRFASVPLPVPGRILPSSVFRNARHILPAHLVDRAGGEVGEGEGAVGGADQAGDLEAEMLEHPADLAVLAFPEAHLDPAVAAGAALQIGVDRAVADAVDLDAVDQLLELLLADLAEDAGAVGALDAGGGQLELALELAVGGEQQQPFGVQVEPADRHDARQALGQAIVDGRAALGVALGGEQAGRLVVAEQAGGLGRADRLAVDGHAVQRGAAGWRASRPSRRRSRSGPRRSSARSRGARRCRRGRAAWRCVGLRALAASCLRPSDAISRPMRCVARGTDAPICPLRQRPDRRGAP